METEKEIQSIGCVLNKIEIKNKRGGVNSRRSYMVEQLMIFMKEDPKNSLRFRYWLGRTRKLEVEKVFKLISNSKQVNKNPQALFNKLLKQENEKAKSN